MTLFLNDHLTDAALAALKTNTLSPEDTLACLEHISGCISCADAFSSAFAEEDLPPVPAGFSEAVLRKMETQKEKNIQVVFYSLRVAFAACVALVILFSGALNSFASLDLKPISPPGTNLLTTLTTGLQDFTQTLNNLEVYQYEKKEK